MGVRGRGREAANELGQPRRWARAALTRPLALHGRCPPAQRSSRVLELLTAVGLPAELADRYPSTHSGGRRQRMAIAPTLAAEPDVLVCDEITSALDPETVEAIMLLLSQLRQERGLALMVISHDLDLLERQVVLGQPRLGLLVDRSHDDHLFRLGTILPRAALRPARTPSGKSLSRKMQPLGGRAHRSDSAGVGRRRWGVAVVRRSSVWGEIARDRELRRRQNERAERMQRKVERELETDASRARATGDREAKAREKERIEAEHRAGLAEAAEQNARLSARVDELSGMLRTCVVRPPLSINDLCRVEIAPFDAGPDAVRLPPPHRPVMQDGGLLSRARRRREFDEAMERYARELADQERHERERWARLASKTAEYEQRISDAQSAAESRAERIQAGVRDGDPASVEDFACQAMDVVSLPDGIILDPKVAYRPDPREVVVDVRLPDVTVVPTEKSVKYVRASQLLTVKERSQTEMANIYRGILAQVPLCVLQTLFKTFDGDVVDSATINGILPTVDRATGRSSERNLVSVTTSRATFDSLVLDATELDPVLCVRELGAKLSPHPLDYEEVPAFLTFEMAKYQLGPSVDVAVGLDGRADLLKMDPFAFEQLVRELLLAMSGRDARATRRSRDEGIDGVVFDCSATMGGEFIVQAKRYRNVVPANDVRALAGVMHDKRANHALFVTSSWFSDDGRRFALDNRVRLIEGPELKHLLREHLALDVLIPSTRRRRAAG